MKCLTDKRVIIPFLLLVLTIPVSCLPAKTVESNQLPAVSSGTSTQTPLTLMQSSNATASRTAPETLQSTASLTETVSATVLPTQTILPPSLPATVKPTRDKKRSTPTASPTLTSTVTETPPTATATPEPSPTRCPLPSAEPFLVEPVTSPTNQLTQVITVYIGNGEEVSVISESGTFTLTGRGPFLVEISLLPNTVHHLEVIAKVRQVTSSNGCIYGGYKMSKTRDKQGSPLTIVQGIPYP